MTNPLGVHAIPGLSAEQNNALLDAFRQFPEIKTVVLYGSRAKGSHRPNSDIDLCIRDSTITLSRLLSLEGLIDDLLFPWTVDLANYDTIDNPTLREHIDRVGIAIYP